MLNEIDKCLTIELNKLKEKIKSLEFEDKFQFILEENFDNELLKLVNFPGVYLFEIKTTDELSDLNQWMTQFLSKWEDEKYKYRFVPNSRSGRIKKHQELATWFPIYLGRAKNVSTRIKGHLYTKMSQPAGALKLLERKNLYGEEFRISTVKIEVENYDLIMPQIEKDLRNRINPILGRQ